MINRFWNKARRASILTIVFLLLGLISNPKFLVLVTFIFFAGPVISNLEILKNSFVTKIKKDNWRKGALLLACILLAFDIEGGGLGFLIFALGPIVWVSLTDKKIFDKDKVLDKPFNVENNEILIKNDQKKDDLLIHSNAINQSKNYQNENYEENKEKIINQEISEVKETISDEVSCQEQINEVKQSTEAKSLVNEESFIDENSNVNWDDLDDSEIFQKLIDSEKISTEILEKLTNSEDWEIRKAIALHDCATEEILNKLRNDDDGDVKNAVKLNKLPKDWKFIFEDEKWYFVDDDILVERLKRRKNLDLNFINILSDSSSDDIKRIIAAHPDTNQKILSKFRNEDDEVKEAIKYRKLGDEWKYLNKNEIAEKIKSSNDIDEKILEFFSKSPENVIRGAVALNSRVPTNILNQLKRENDKYIKQCIAYRDLPNEWYSENDFQKVGKIKNTNDLDESVLKILSTSTYDEIKVAVALHPNATESILDILKKDDSDDVKDAVAYRELPKEWQSLDDNEKLQKIQGSEELPMEIIDIFLKSHNWRIREALIENDKLDLSLLKSLIYDNDSDVSSKAQDKFLPEEWKNIHNDNTKFETLIKQEIPIEILEILAGSPNEEIKKFVANYEKTSNEVLKILSKDQDYDICEAAQNRLLPQEWVTLLTLEDEEIISKLNEENVSEEIYDILSESYNWRVKKIIALHDKTPIKYLEKLSNENDADIKDALLFRSLPKEWKMLEDYEKIEKLEIEDNVAQNVLNILAKSQNSSLREAIAIHPNISLEDLDSLEFDERSEVRDATLFRKLPGEWRKISNSEKAEKLRKYEGNFEFSAIDNETLEILGQAEDSEIKMALAVHPIIDSNSEIIRKLDFDEDSYVRDAVLFRSLPNEWRYLESREMIEKLENDESPIASSVTEILSKTEDWNLKVAVASCKYTSTEILKFLSFDDDDDVREAAKKGLKKKGTFTPSKQSGPQEIYIKTEPAGKILFGELDEDEIEILNVDIDQQELSEEIEELKSNSSGIYAEYEGVFSYGDNGDDGNEGIIKFNDGVNSRIEIPLNDEGALKDGVYFCQMRLSKASISFEFNTPDKLEYDRSNLSEISVPVNLPSSFTKAHELYGNEISQPFNITIGFEYNGSELDEYDNDLVDRGYDDLFIIVRIKEGKETVLYSNYNGTETWIDSLQLNTSDNAEVNEKASEVDNEVENYYSAGPMFQNDISFVYKDIDKTTDNLETTIKELLIKHMEESVAAPFFYDYELSDLNNQLPSKWKLEIDEKYNLKPDQIRISIVNAYFSADRHFEDYVEEFQNQDIKLTAERIGIINFTGEDDEDVVAITNIKAPFDKNNGEELLELRGAFGESPIKLSITLGSNYLDADYGNSKTFTKILDEEEWVKYKDYLDPDEFELNKDFLNEVTEYISSTKEEENEEKIESEDRSDAENEREEWLRDLREDGNVLQHATEEESNDLELVMAAVSNNGNSLAFASKELQDNAQVVMEAMKNNANAFIYASERLRKSDEIKELANNYEYPEDGVDEEINLNELVWDRGYIKVTEEGSWYNLFVTEQIKGYYPNEKEALAALNDFYELDLSMYEEYNQINFFVPDVDRTNNVEEMTDILI